jgi:hypothetical protein
MHKMPLYAFLAALVLKIGVQVRSYKVKKVAEGEAIGIATHTIYECQLLQPIDSANIPLPIAPVM